MEGNKQMLTLAILTLLAIIAIVGYLVVSKTSKPVEVVPEEIVQPINPDFDTSLLNQLETWSQQ